MAKKSCKVLNISTHEETVSYSFGWCGSDYGDRYFGYAGIDKLASLRGKYELKAAKKMRSKHNRVIYLKRTFALYYRTMIPITKLKQRHNKLLNTN